MGTAGVFRYHAAILDDQTSGGAAGVLPVDENVGCDFTEDGIPQAATFNAFQVKRIGQMFFDEGKDAIVAFDQVGDDQITIVVAVEINLTENKISSMRWTDSEDQVIGSQ